MLPKFSSPNVPHAALMRMFVFLSAIQRLWCILDLKESKTFKYLTCIIVSAMHKRCWKPKINPEGKDTRILLKSSINRSMQLLQILTNERPFIYLNRQATIVKLIMNNEITILRMSNHV